MESIAISVVEVDPAGTLRLRPNIGAAENYEHIYRTASAVRWLRGRTHTYDSFLAWLAAVTSCFRQNLKLFGANTGKFSKLTPDTQWVNVSSEDRTTIEGRLQMKLLSNRLIETDLR